jgi:hypothetical protein
VPETDKSQKDWRFCDKCRSIFWVASFEASACPGNQGGHVPQGFNFVLPHDVPEEPGKSQKGWAFCKKCHSMHWTQAPNPQKKKICAGGDAHNPDHDPAGSFPFVLPYIPE